MLTSMLEHLLLKILETVISFLSISVSLNYERDRETQGRGGGGGGGRGEGEGIPLVWRSEDSFKNFVLFF